MKNISLNVGDSIILKYGGGEFKIISKFKRKKETRYEIGSDNLDFGINMIDVDKTYNLQKQTLSYSKFMEDEWKPKTGEKYWYIDDYYFSIDWAECGKYEHSYNNLKIGNYFRTRELARQAKKKIEQVLKECKHG